MSGDTLARGGKSATFGPPKVTQEKWDKIWEKDEEENVPVSKPNDIRVQVQG